MTLWSLSPEYRNNVYFLGVNQVLISMMPCFDFRSTVPIPNVFSILPKADMMQDKVQDVLSVIMQQKDKLP